MPFFVTLSDNHRKSPIWNCSVFRTRIGAISRQFDRFRVRDDTVTHQRAGQNHAFTKLLDLARRLHIPSTKGSLQTRQIFRNLKSWVWRWVMENKFTATEVAAF